MKTGETVHWESPVERDAILLFEYNTNVLDYVEQPSEEVYYDEGGVLRRCYPDFGVNFLSGIYVLYEIKSEEQLRHSKATQKKIALIALNFERQKRPYRVLTSLEIRRQPRYDNILRLHDARRAHLANSILLERIRQFDESLSYTFETLTRELGRESAVLSMVAIGVLRMDLEEKIEPQSLVWFPGNTEVGDGSFSL